MAMAEKLTKEDYAFLLGDRPPPGDIDRGIASSFDAAASGPRSGDTTATRAPSARSGGGKAAMAHRVDEVDEEEEEESEDDFVSAPAAALTMVTALSTKSNAQNHDQAARKQSAEREDELVSAPAAALTMVTALSTKPNTQGLGEAPVRQTRSMRSTHSHASHLRSSALEEAAVGRAASRRSYAQQALNRRRDGAPQSASSPPSSSSEDLGAERRKKQRGGAGNNEGEPPPSALTTALVAAGATRAFDDDLATAEAAADAIEELMLRREDDRRAPLWVSLASTLRCRFHIAEEASIPPRSADWLVNSAKSHPRAFGRALAGAWTLSPYRRDQDLEASLTPAGRVFSLPGLSRKQMAGVRGLLQHLEWAVRNDPRVQSEALLRREGEARALEGSGPAGDEPQALLDDVAEFQAVLNPGFSKAGTYEPNDGFAPIERLLALRERLEDSHGSLANAFAAMDIEGRGVVSFEHFHAHLVKLRLCRVDAEGSLKALELFKMLDRDRDDLLGPRDIVRAMEAAVRHLRAAPALLEARAFAKEQGILDPRFLRDIGGTGDLMSRLATFKRYIEARHGGTFEEWMRRMDPDRNGYIEREAFVDALVGEGYCVSTGEAEELFMAFDVQQQDRIPIERLLVQEDWGVFWTANSATGPVWNRKVPTVEEMHKALMNVQPSVGLGGLFSDPGRLDTPCPPEQTSPRRRGNERGGGEEEAPPDGITVAERLASIPIGQFRGRRGDDDKPERMRADREERIKESQERRRALREEAEARAAERLRQKKQSEKEVAEEKKRWSLEKREDARRERLLEQQRQQPSAEAGAGAPKPEAGAETSESAGGGLTWGALQAVLGGLQAFEEAEQVKVKAATDLQVKAHLHRGSISHANGVRGRLAARAARKEKVGSEAGD